MTSHQHRIVSLLPGATEIVAALGKAETLVGRSHECDFPPGLKSLPVCSEPVIDATASSSEINRQVEQKLENALSIFRIDIDQIRRLRPTVILTQMQCEVCAVSENDVRAAIAEIGDPAPEVLSLSPSVLADLWSDVARIADVMDCESSGRKVIGDAQRQLAEIQSRIGAAASHPRVACIEWLDPLMTAGNWVPELVEMAGGQNLFGRAGEHSPWLTWDTLAESDPDVILVFPCGFTLSRIRDEYTTLSARSEWQALRAVRDGRVFLIDGHRYLNRPGPRLVDSTRIIAEILHPELFDPAHRDAAWSECL